MASTSPRPGHRLGLHLPLSLALWALGGPLAAQSLPVASPESVGFDTHRLERLTGTLHDYVDQGLLPGGVALVARHGKLAYREAFGQRDVEARDPMESDDLFRIASQSKAIVSAAVLMLQEEGRLLTTDPVSRYLPAFGETTVAVPDGEGYRVVPAESRITLRHLLTHTSGVGYGTGPAADRWEAAGITGWYFADRDEPIRATVDRIAALPFDAQPGERWIYGYSIDILGAVVEVASGLPLDEFLRQRIFEPLGMKDTHFYVPEGDEERLAVVYSLQGGQLERAPNPGAMVGQGAYVEGPRKSFSGGAGLVSTADDYARFLQMVLNGGELDGVRVLAPSTVDLMTTNHVGDLRGEADGFGFGFGVVRDPGARGIPGSAGEFGWGGAYHSVYWVDPARDLVVVYLTQVIPSGGLDDHAKLRALVYQALVDD